MVFGVVLVERSFPMEVPNFTQIGPLRWLLDLTTLTGTLLSLSLSNLLSLQLPSLSLSRMAAGGSSHPVKEVCVFLLRPDSIPPGKALAIYVQAPGQPFLFYGAIHFARPSAVLSLPCPDEPSAAVTKIGVLVEDFATLPWWPTPTPSSRPKG